MAVGKVLLKQYRNLVLNIDSFSGGEAKLSQSSSSENDCCDLSSVTVTLAPTTGPYRGGSFVFEISVGDDFPSEAPAIYSTTPIYHPNIDDTGEVCLNLFDELWTSTNTMEDVIQGLLFLLHNPNIEDPLSEMFTGTETYEDYEINVRKSLRGEEVEGVEFERNLAEGYESGDTECKEDKEKSTDVCETDSNKILRLKISSVDLPEVDERREQFNISLMNSSQYFSSFSRTKRAADMIGRVSTFVYVKFNNWFSAENGNSSSVDVPSR